MKAEVLKQRLERLESVLLQHGETDLALMIRPALEGSEQDLRAFLVSNELWGGAGSIADQAGASQGRGDARREIEGALIRLGLEQIRQDVVNSRTDMWVDTFCQWRQAGISQALRTTWHHGANAAPRGHENGAGDTLPAAMKGNKPPTPEPPIPTLAEFIETCRAEFRFLVDDFGFQEARYSDPYQQFLVRFIKDDRWLDVYGEGYGTIAACRVGCGTRGPLALIWLVPEASLPKRSRQRDQMGQLDQIRELGQFAREHAKDFLSGDTSRFALIWDAKHAPRPHQNTGPSRLPP